MSALEPISAPAISRPSPTPTPGAPRSPSAVAAGPDTAPFESSNEGQPSLFSRVAATFGRSLRRRWLLAGLFGLFCGWLTGFAIWSCYPGQHAAEVWLKINSPPRDPAADNSPRTQAAPIKSPQTLEAALREPELDNLLTKRPQPHPLRWLDQHVSSDAAPGQAIVRVTAVSDRADEPAILVNALADALIKETDAAQQANLAKTRDAYQRTQESLREKRAALAQRHNPRLATLESDLQALQLERKKIQAELDMLPLNHSVQVVAQPAGQELQVALQKDGQLREYQKEVDRLEDQIRARLEIATLGEYDATVKRLNGQLKRWNDKVAARRAEIAAAVGQQPTSKPPVEVQTGRVALEQKLRGIEEVVKNLEAEKARVAAQTGGETEIAGLRADVAAEQETVRRLGVELQALEAEGTANSVTRLGETSITPDVNRGRRLLATGLGGGAIMVVLPLLIVWFGTSDKRVGSTSELAIGLKVPVLGVVPEASTAPTLADLSKPGPQLDAVDVLRTLLLRRTENGPIILQVTSAVEGEGKTTLASHLAASLARAWRKTLLIDGNLRKPAAHTLFQTALEPGLCDLLRGDCVAAEAIQPTALTRLWLLPAGTCDSFAAQALAQQETMNILWELREQYEFIIIDSGPVLPTADALLLSQHADAIVLTVRCGTSQLPTVKAAQLRLSAINVPLIGAVVLGGS